MGIKAFQNYATLTQSPLVLAPVIESFFFSLEHQERSVLLGYLVLPIVLHPPSRQFLWNAKSTSSLITFCKNKDFLAGLSVRVERWKHITGIAMQNSVSCNYLEVKEDLSVAAGQVTNVVDGLMPKETKAAKKLAHLMSPYSVPAVYRILGVGKL
ncbi:three component ABC system middle component [Dyella sp. GSA-30]|uniref:three component ABC system middle component n=1 Tax=Dyella sp. GSA-30 TaxID=2994496 RepID=UPI002493C0A4|nr:three component ABC system middle component [Dyella sp. GSA-30]